ncbi:nanoRNase/pAp phosphatase, hydrolyzes c-di-AMP and oligoRNAs [Marinospirillum celere]|uniref:NanoRNase/pAp phosphatase, hydrolyzes c-di-AMP and oligoRNAs n=1 Tax=Marinospirillum celere TaxID=1122252 RepID=A0A1I1IRJ8_9GAMM|nr:exopolyphosphatase [Marinospirillum celere]SFC38856.1 nanoRNase/pAp phosphatase, hydrolyzes c-di-AMP and oligoRNAs [Marinospirillum celere]
MSEKYRLVTRSDFDGLVCAALLKHLDLIDDIQFVHPKDMQDGKVEITGKDITTNLPYVPGCHLAFDHHLSETLRNENKADNHIIDPDAPSAARVVFDYYGGHKAFPARWDDMMEAVDKGDSANFTEDEVLNPEGWVLLNFIMDARTGLGRFREFRISNYQLMMQLIDYCRNHSIEQILELPDVKERTQLYFEHDSKARQQLQKCASVHGNLVVLDLREQETIYATNRFTLYALYPQCNISIHVMWGLKKQNTVFAIGKSILNKTSNTNVGELCLNYNGGGHLNAGTCQVENDQAEQVLQELITKINQDG